VRTKIASVILLILMGTNAYAIWLDGYEKLKPDLNTVTDVFQGYTWYICPISNRFVMPDKHPAMHLELQKMVFQYNKSTKTEIQYFLTYVLPDDEWNFPSKATFVVDGERIILDTDTSWTAKVTTGSILIKASLLSKIASCKSFFLKLEGTEKSYEIEFNENELSNLKSFNDSVNK
jgi:hypothetical protein